MFDGFDTTADAEQAKRLSGASLAAVIVMGIVGAAAVLVAGRPVLAAAIEKKVDVTFRKLKVEIPVAHEAPPPPKPKSSVNRVPSKARPSAAAMVAPKELPTEAPPESTDVVEAIEVAVGGTGDGKGNEIGGAKPDDMDAPQSRSSRGMSNVAESSTLPEPLEGNEQPAYPEAARKTGLEAQVALKVLIDRDGSVSAVEVVEGVEPFASAAINAVKQWKYEAGAPEAVYRLVKIKFQLRE
jgi:periplasmic protein TonB